MWAGAVSAVVGVLLVRKEENRAYGLFCPTIPGDIRGTSVEDVSFLRNRRTTRARRTVLAPALVVLLIVGGVAGSLWWWRGQESEVARAADAYAVAVARAIGAGTLPPDGEVGDRAAAQQDLDRVLEGMGSIEQRVTVGEVVLEDGEDEGRVVLEHSWTIQKDKEPWSYETTMLVTRSGQTWRGQWSPR